MCVYMCIYIYMTTIEIGSMSLKKIMKSYKGGIGGRKLKGKVM